jgi:hypothetical protein
MAIDTSLTGIAATKLSPEEYYRQTGQLLKKEKLTPKKDLTKESVEKLAATLRKDTELKQYFTKCAELGLYTDVAVNAVISHMGSKARECTLHDVNGDPYITLATCMLRGR